MASRAAVSSAKTAVQFGPDLSKPKFVEMGGHFVTATFASDYIILLVEPCMLATSKRGGSMIDKTAGRRSDSQMCNWQ